MDSDISQAMHLQGVNHGYFLSQVAPIVLGQLPTSEQSSPYIEGLKQGHEEYQSEIAKSREAEIRLKDGHNLVTDLYLRGFNHGYEFEGDLPSSVESFTKPSQYLRGLIDGNAQYQKDQQKDLRQKQSERTKVLEKINQKNQERGKDELERG